MVTMWIIISMVFLVFWTILGIQTYKSYIKRKVSKEKIIKSKKRYLILLIITAIIMIVVAVCSYIDFSVQDLSLLSITSQFLFMFLNMYVANIRFLHYIEDNQEGTTI